jgi:hypothetical protein
MRANIKKHYVDYQSNNKNLNHPLLKAAFSGTGSTYYKIPENFIKVGEY